jgi:hypothetical protein
MDDGQNSKRRLAICRSPALDEVLAQSLPIIQISVGDIIFRNFMRANHVPGLSANWLNS